MDSRHYLDKAEKPSSLNSNIIVKPQPEYQQLADNANIARHEVDAAADKQNTLVEAKAEIEKEIEKQSDPEEVDEVSSEPSEVSESESDLLAKQLKLIEDELDGMKDIVRTIFATYLSRNTKILDSS